LVEWPRDHSTFEKLIQKVIAQLAESGKFGGAFQVFQDAADSFHRRRGLGDPPGKPSLNDIGLLDTENAVTALHESLSYLEQNDFLEAQKGIVEAVIRVQRNAWLNISEETLQALSSKQRMLTSVGSILGVPPEAFITDIEPTLSVLVLEPSKRETTFKHLQSEQLKKALSAALSVLDQRIVGEGSEVRSWAEKLVGELSAEVAAKVTTLVGVLNPQITALRGKNAQTIRDYEVATERWRKASTEAREMFHRSAAKAAELQWLLGPEFLLTLEDVCRKEQLWVRSIPWDPARMVGWKIAVRNVKLEFRDLQIAANELSSDSANDPSEKASFGELADGSYFTDYVHHIAMSKPGFSPRTVTCDLVLRLLRPGEMMTLITKDGGQVPDGADAPCLADLLLTSLGWRAADAVSERSLADCITKASGGLEALKEGLSGNDVRIVLESFCKDLLDVLIAALGYSHDEVWRTIDERIPEYRAGSKKRDWDEEVRQMTVGSALLLFRALGPFAFPARENDLKICLDALTMLSESLNRMSHHTTQQFTRREEDGDLASQIRVVLTKTQALLGELPWHLTPSFVYGEQPKVISGEAWSHGSDTRRLLRVIVWTGIPIGTQVTLWNRTRRNPVISDPVFIERPRPGYHGLYRR
jgi:hypothetical protein